MARHCPCESGPKQLRSHTYSKHDEEHDRPYPGPRQLEHHLRVRDEHQTGSALHHVADRGPLRGGDEA